MARTTAKLSASLLFLSSIVSAQGLTTVATKDDWEEINFEFNSHTLSDGYPSLLRLAELLNKNAAYKVKLSGHTDWIGSHPYNDKLGARRSQAVQQFLEKYGARPGQISSESKGKNTPKVDNKSAEGRFINRRVEMTVTDGTGKIIGAGGVGDAIKTLEALAKKQEECCSQILRRLDKLDEILALVKDLKGQNEKMQRDLDELKSRRAAAGPAGPAGAAGAAGAGGAGGAAGAGGAGTSPSQLEQVADRAAKKAVEEMRGGNGRGPGGPQFALLGLNAGPDGTGKATFSGRARLFAPLSSSAALQAQGEYMYWRDRKEGQFDVGLVNRWKAVQMGAFASFKTVGMVGMDSNGTLGQFAFAADYLFKQGRIGAFGTKSFLDNSTINRKHISTFVVEETYLRVMDQIGGQGAVQLGNRAYFEGSLGYIHSQSGNTKPGGTMRLVFPINKMFAMTAEGGINETLISKETTGSARFGILFGNYMQPKEFLAASGPVPMEIPRVKYEVLTRRLRTGNSPPVADAGPDQIGVAAGRISLDGSGSFDPDGDPITFQWLQIAGPAVTLADAKQAKTSFTAVEGQQYSFRLTVTDDHGGQGIARTTITTRESPRVRIIRFLASPSVLGRPGDPATLNYLVENADAVTISGVTTTLRPDSGTAEVRPMMTTTYTLTARNRVSEESAVATVMVNNPLPRIIRFQADPATVLRGQPSRLSWQTMDADSVEIPNVGSFPPNGSVEVRPEQTTAYTLIARSRFGEATAATVVNVQMGNRPVIAQFSANPTTIVEGDSSTLTWRVEGSDNITISGLGKVDASGSGKVTPPVTTTYTLTAVNQFGTSTMQATVEVLPRVRIITFTAVPATINAPGQPVTFTWQAENCLYVFIDGGIGTRPCTGSLTNAGPIATQTYTMTAIGRGSSASAAATVTLVKPDNPVQPKPPVIVISQSEIVTSFRDVLLNASGSQDPNGGQLTFSWRSVDNKGDVLNPTSATPTVRLRDINYGDFLFEVTVTNSAGLSAKATVRVILVLARPLF